MFRTLSAIAVGLALASAFALYVVSYDTRRLDADVSAQERRIERLRSDIAVLKAELAFLSRPERIEPLARSMGFQPANGAQYIEPDTLASAGSSPDRPRHASGAGQEKETGQRPSNE